MEVLIYQSLSVVVAVRWPRQEIVAFSAHSGLVLPSRVRNWSNKFQRLIRSPIVDSIPHPARGYMYILSNSISPLSNHDPIPTCLHLGHDRPSLEARFPPPDPRGSSGPRSNWIPLLTQSLFLYLPPNQEEIHVHRRGFIFLKKGNKIISENNPRIIDSLCFRYRGRKGLSFIAYAKQSYSN